MTSRTPGGRSIHISLPSVKFNGHLFIHLSLLTMTSKVLTLAVCRTPVTYQLSWMTLLSMNSLSYQWIERPPSSREVMGSILVEDSDFFVVPRSCHVDQFTFHATDCVKTQQTPRRKLKIWRTAEYFWEISSYLEIWLKTVVIVWYIFSIEI